MEPVQLAPGIPQLVDTGVRLDLPFMLVAHVTGSRTLAERRVTAHAEYLSCDDRDSIKVLLTLAVGAEPHWLKEDEPVAHAHHSCRAPARDSSGVWGFEESTCVF